ncbi:MAG TPA: RNA polymerase sigma factor, partial [Polyangiaceae bacterium]
MLVGAALASNLVRLEERPTDAELVTAALRGELTAKEQLFRRYVGMASATTYRLIGRDSELEDIVQESFMQALATLDRLVEPQAFSAWLMRIVVGAAIATLRRRRLLTRLGLIRPEPIQLESLVTRDVPPDIAADLRSIYRLIDALPAAERVILVLRRVEELSLQEIADRTNWSLATVKRKLARAERLLDASMVDH